MIAQPFSGPDSRELYNKNRVKLGKHWYYHDHEITYSWNSAGYRMYHEIHETDWKNYIHFTGCSYAVGSGVELEYTYPYLISKQLHCDYVNTATIGASVELVLKNSVEFLLNCKHPPKAMVVNWPEISRTMWWEGNGNIGLYMPKEFSGEWTASYKEFLMHPLHMENRFDVIRSTIKLICNSMNIPLIEVSTALSFDLSYNNAYPDIKVLPSFHTPVDLSHISDIENMHHYWARDFGFHDGGHPGWSHHKNAANIVVGLLNDR